MRIEVLPRIWIADKIHSKNQVKHLIKVHQLNLSEATHSVVLNTLFTLTSKMYHLSVSQLQQVLLIDRDLHSMYITYMILVAYIIRYGKIPVERAIDHLKSKTLPFRFTNVHLKYIHSFEKNIRNSVP